MSEDKPQYKGLTPEQKDQVLTDLKEHLDIQLSENPENSAMNSTSESSHKKMADSLAQEMLESIAKLPPVH